MKLTWNGTGSAWSPYYGNSSAVLEAGGKRLLVDCGHTVPARLQEMGLTLRDIDAVFISHLHGDHVYGLEEWGFRSLLQWKIRPQLLIAADLADMLWQQVLAGTMAQVCDKTCRLTDYFQVTPMQIGKPVSLDPWTLTIHPVRHVPNACAYGLKVAAESTTLGFTCDTLADGDPWFYQDTDQVFHDCSFAPYFPETVHAHFEQLCRYPQEFRMKTYLVHYEDDIRACRADPRWQAEVSATGMRLTVPFQTIPY
ncbi:MAG TPA: MBL fold metallo-hydrolase [Chthonomonadaceae bacterium]|nr:MBL fold metallo-hydrolase [Chthonomonadaceae bacterium]